jgi:hypothetical protein
MSGLSVFRLLGNVSVNGGYGVAEVAEFGLPANMIKTGRFTNARLPLEPSFGGNVTVQGHVLPSANVTYDLGSASMRWKDLYLSGNTIVLGNTFIREGLNDSVQLGGNSTTVSAEAFSGNGALLTSLDASQLTSGVVPNARISGAYSGFTTLETSGDLTIGGNLYVLTGNVVEIQTETQITDQLIVTNAGTGPALIVEQTGAQDIADFKDDGNVVVRIHDGGAVSIGGDVAVPLGALHVVGNVYASGTYVGNGAGLTALNASQLSVGTVPADRFGTNVRIGTGAGMTIQGSSAVAVGISAGQASQGNTAVAIGREAGQTSQGLSAVAIGLQTGQTSQGINAVAIGANAGKTSQSQFSVAIGNECAIQSQGTASTAVGAGAGSNYQGRSCVAVGVYAGTTSQNPESVAIGIYAGSNIQGTLSVAVGSSAGTNVQGNAAVAVGYSAGCNVQKADAVAVGRAAGFDNQGSCAVAVGYLAGYSSQASNSIVINATGEVLNNTTANSCVIKPVRDFAGTVARRVALYDATSGEVSTNSGHFVVDASNNVGIGTTSPGSRFHIQAPPGGAGGPTAGSDVYNIVVDQGFDYTNRYYHLADITNNNGHLLLSGILGHHNVGGGNCIFDVKFAVRDGFTQLGYAYGTLNTIYADIIVVNDMAGARRRAYLKTGGFAIVNIDMRSTQGVTITYNGTFSTTSPGTAEFTLSTNVGQVMRMSDSGNVGIGTTTPNAPLVVFGGEGTYNAPTFGSGNRGAIHIRSGTNDRRNAITFSSSLTSASPDAAQAGIYVNNSDSAGTTMHFATTDNYAAGPQARVTIGNTGNVGIGLTNPTASLQVQGTCRIDNNPAVNTAHSTSGYRFLMLSSENAIQGWGKGSNAVAGIFTTDPTNGGWSSAASILYLAKSTSTNRSINAAGTVNASGADYAEYMTKNGDFVVAKGDVVGVDSQGFLTNAYDDAVTFVIKSTNPSLVGGDDWGVEDAEHPKPPEPSSPPGDDASEEDIVAFNEAVAAHDAWTAEFEAKRARVDRIAFSGQVPVNVFGATPGDYIVPVRRGNDDDGGISAIAVPDASITFEQYRKAVGKVVKILDDGRAFAIVKVA